MGQPGCMLHVCVYVRACVRATWVCARALPMGADPCCSVPFTLFVAFLLTLRRACKSCDGLGVDVGVSVGSTLCNSCVRPANSNMPMCCVLTCSGRQH